MIYEILDNNNNVINTAVADIDFMKTAYENYRELTSESTLKELKERAIQEVVSISTAQEPVTINEITYNGGDSSASAINGAVQLAQTLGETEVKLWDVNNVIAIYTFEEAMNISAQIAQAYRDKQFAKYELIAQINACETLEELEAIEI